MRRTETKALGEGYESSFFLVQYVQQQEILEIMLAPPLALLHDYAVRVVRTFQTSHTHTHTPPIINK